MSDEVKKETPKEEKSFFTKKSEAGKGDVPRNISKKYRDNYDSIFIRKNKNEGN
jgi:hypothetical protein